MTAFWRFGLYNLGASLAAGLLAYAAVKIALRLLKAQNAFLYASFLALPLVKSILILLGIGLIFPWSKLVNLSRQALPAIDILPFIILWFVASWSLYQWFVKRARADLLLVSAPPSGEEKARLENALEQVIRAYKKATCCEAGETVCCISDKIPTQPRLLLADKLRSPVALVEGGQPIIIFPKGFASCLDERELALALAHELNHFALRKPGGWSTGNLRILALVSPVALLLSGSLHREEEKACDDLAVRMLGGPEIYAEMLMKSYQFARQKTYPGWKKSFLPQLLGTRSFLSERIERLLNKKRPARSWIQSSLFSWCVWVVLLYLLFFARLGA